MRARRLPYPAQSGRRKLMRSCRCHTSTGIAARYPTTANAINGSVTTAPQKRRLAGIPSRRVLRPATYAAGPAGARTVAGPPSIARRARVVPCDARDGDGVPLPSDNAAEKLVRTSTDWNFADLFEAVADTVPDKTAIVCDGRRSTYAELDERSTRLANHLIDAGVAVGDHVGIYAYNGSEWVEAMFGIWKARAVPINVNYRYVEAELAYLFDNADLVALVHGREFIPRIDAVRADLPKLKAFVSVEDGSDEDLATIGAVEYEAALAAASAERVPGPRSPDDLYMLYTGGTTGMPKGVMWRNGDAMVDCFGGSKTAASIADFVADASKGSRALIGPPFMHGAGHWIAFNTLLGGGTVFVQSVPERLDPVDMWSLVEREKLNFMLIVGDAFARPLLDELDRNT